MAVADWVVFGLIVVGLCSVAAAIVLGLLKLSRWFKRKLDKPAPNRKPQKSTPPWIWVFLIALTALVAYVVSGSGRKGPGQPPVEPSISGWLMALLVVGGFIAIFVLLVGVQLYRQYDRDVSHAVKLASAGDKDGAIFDLKAAMEGRKPSALRSNGLGVVHSLRDEWAEAYKAFLEAESIGGHLASYVGNQGVALLKLGRAAEAEPLLAEACSMDPHSPVFACYHGFVLTELGRLDEATLQLENARKSYKWLLTFPPSAKKPLLEEIDKLRQKLEEARGKGAAQEYAEL